METIELVAVKRDQAGTGVARRLRRAGRVPAVVYGNGATVPISISLEDFTHVQKIGSGENTVIDMRITGDDTEACSAIVRETQIAPLSRALLHVDFYRVNLTMPITVMVSIEFINEPVDLLKRGNAILRPILREVAVECLPRQIPEVIQLDLATMQVGDTLKAEALRLPEGVTLLVDAQESVVTTSVIAEDVAAVPEGAGAGAAGEGGAAG